MNDITEIRRRMQKKLGKRHRSEKRFRIYGLLAVCAGLVFLAVLFATIIDTGANAFRQTKILLNVDLASENFGAERPPTAEAVSGADYHGIIKHTLRTDFPEVTSRQGKRALYKLISSGAAFELQDHVMEAPDLVGSTISIWVTASDDVDMIIKGTLERNAPEDVRRLSDEQIRWLETLENEERVKAVFNNTFFTAGDSREPELAGIWGAAVGSIYTMLVTMLLSFPIGVISAVYLEEFAPKNRFTKRDIPINRLNACCIVARAKKWPPYSTMGPDEISCGA